MTERRRLYLFSPLPPQRNGLADYILEYLPGLAADFELLLVVESGLLPAAREAMADHDDLLVIDEAGFLARQPDRDAQCLYNLGNNADCAWQLDHLHRFPGAVIVHDVSLFYLHQVATQRARAHPLMGAWLAQDHHPVPHEFTHADGSLACTPGLVYQECVMLRRLAAASRGLMVHTAYAEQRLRGGVDDVPLGAEHGRPLVRIPHFVHSDADRLDPALVREVLERFGVAADDFLLLVPGFLTGNKMLYEVLVAFREAQAQLPGLRLLFAGEERADEYPLSARIAMLWPEGDGPRVTGYLDATELDALLGRADLSFVLRYPTYGESSGILPRAALGGGEVLTVDIGAYPEFRADNVHAVPVGAGAVAALIAGIDRAHHDRQGGRTGARLRLKRRQELLTQLQALSPQALYPRLRAWLDESHGVRP